MLFLRILTFATQGLCPIFFISSNTLAHAVGDKERPLRIKKTNHTLVVKSHTGFLSHNNANELVKQGVINPRKDIPKFISVFAVLSKKNN